MARTSIGLVTDSTCDLPAGVAERYPVAVVPLVVNWDDQTYRDKIDLSTTDFYQRLRTSKTTPKTGAPSPGAFEQVYREQLEAHEHVISVHLAAKLSATYDVARSAAESVDPARISVVDSGSVSLGSGWLVEAAGRLAEEGAEPAAIVSHLQSMSGRLRIFALLETLEFLKRGGRIGRAAAFAGTLLNVKPIIAIRDGEVHPVERVRTMSGAIRRLVELVAKHQDLERLGLMHADNPSGLEEVERQLQPHFPTLTIDKGELTSVVGTHAGPGCIGVALLHRG